MRSHIRAFVSLPLWIAILATSAYADDDAATRVRTAVETAMSARGLGPLSGPGCAVSVTQADRPLVAAGYGAANIEHAVAFDTRTVSESGSVAKQFMAAAIFVLAEQGRLALTDDIRKYLPEMPDYGATIRILDLVHQTSGLREWSTLAALRGYPRAYRKIYTLDDLFAIIAAQRSLNFAPGTRYEYSNSNYGLLTVILERVSGMSAQEFSEQHLFAPLGMRSTQWRDDHRRLVPRRATAYRRTANGFEHAMPMEEVFGHGALLTTVEDLQRWNHALMNGGLSPFVMKHLMSPGRLSNGEERLYGGGLRLGTYRDRVAFRHAGVTAGYNAQLWAFPNERVSIALLCNVSPGESAQLVESIADAALGLEASPHAPATSGGGYAPAAGVEPSYFMAANGEIVAVDTQGSRTFVNLFTRPGFVEVTGSRSGMMTALQPNYGTLEFRYQDRDHVVVSLESREPTVFTRMPRAAASIDIEGRYANADLGVIYEVKQQPAGCRMELTSEGVDDPLVFRLEWLNGDVYLARIETRSGYIRDDFVLSFSRKGLTLSSVGGLQGVDMLTFTRVASTR